MTGPLELLDVDHLLTVDERDIQAEVRDFVDRRVKPSIGDWYERGEVDLGLMKEAGSLGLLGMHLEGYGCAGTNAVSYGLACLELEAGDSGVRSMVSVQGSLAMFAIWKFGTEDQKNTWLPPMATGEAIGCFGLTEADFGSNPAGMRTRAKRDGDEWVLNGTKMWITNGSVADVGDRLGADRRGHPRLRRAHGQRRLLGVQDHQEIVAAGIDHLRAGPGRCAAAGRGSTARRRWVARSAVVPQRGAVRHRLRRARRRSGLPRGCLGLRGTREVFDRPLASFQLTQAKLADMALELQKGFLLALHLGRLKDDHRLQPRQVSLGKLNNVREALAIARECRTILGASGITLEYPILRHANNLESVLTYEGTSEVHQLIIGEALTGENAFS